MTLPYNHDKLDAMQQFVQNNDLEAIITEQIKVMHIKVCNTSGQHVKLKIGKNKGKCKYCLKKIKAAPIDDPTRINP